MNIGLIPFFRSQDKQILAKENGTVTKWLADANVCRIVFWRTGDFRITDSTGITIVNEDGSTRPYDPARDADSEGMIWAKRVEKAGDIIIEDEPPYRQVVDENDQPKPFEPAPFKDVRFTGPIFYNATWYDNVGSAAYRPGNAPSGYYVAGKIVWSFPEKATLDPFVTGGIDRTILPAIKWP